MKAIILAAGFAKRLYPLTENKAKSLLEINGKLVIDYILKKLEELPEINEKIIITNNRFYEQFLDWKKEREIKILNNRVNDEENRLGAIGDILFVLEKENINDDILVIAGDALIDFSLKEPLRLFKEEKKDLTLFRDIKNIEEAKRFGVGFVENNLLTDFEEKPKFPKSALCSVPIYFYKKDTLNLIKEYNGNLDAPGNLLKFLHKKIPIYSYITNDTWIDIGTIESLKIAEKKFK